jgi:O-antigen/teichoic acid export membrane protein
VVHKTASSGSAPPGDPGQPDRRGRLALRRLRLSRATQAQPAQPVPAVPPGDPGYPLVFQPTMPMKLQGLRHQLADPLARNGYSLIANSAATGALGLVYWLVMARLYPAADVGRASAAYAAMNLLAGITALNFNGALTRFIPEAGHYTVRFITRAYTVSALTSVALAFLFLVTVSRWGPSYAELGHPIAGLIFVGCVVVWAVFTLQDSVLVGLRNAFWVFAENAAFGVVKLVLLVLLVTALPDHTGIYVSWMLPAVIALPLVNALIFGSLVPLHVKLTRDLRPPTVRQITQFLAGDYTGALCVLATGSLIPVLVASRIAVQATAYFYMAWTVASIVDTIGLSMGMSLTVEGSFNAARVAVHCRRALARLALILLPCAALLAVAAPWGLRLFGSAYAEYGAPVLRLLAIATVPRAATELYLGALRAQSRTTLVAVIQAARAVLMLGLTVVLIGKIGTVGAGAAVAVTQAVIAVSIAYGLWRVLTADRARTVPASGPRTMPGEDECEDEYEDEYDRAADGAAGPGGGNAGEPGGDRDGDRDAGGSAPVSGSTLVLPRLRRRPLPVPGWAPTAAVALAAAAGLALFFTALPRVSLAGVNGLGLISVLPVTALAGVTLVALAFIVGISLRGPRPVLLGAILAGLVVCLDGVTAFVEAEPRFPTAYQIAGFVNYVSSTGHAAPGLAAYFSWPGFFALVSFVTGAAGTHGMLTLLKVWPMAIDLLYLPPLFLLTRNLRISWRARWLAGFLFTVGNWVGQDYFSPQAFNYLLYLVFVAILVNWFARPPGRQPPRLLRAPRWRRLRSPPPRPFGEVRPGELRPRPASTGEKAFLLALLVGLFTVSTMSHQLTPFFMLGACAALIVVRRCNLTGLPVLLGVILVGWVSFAAVGYWTGHLNTIFGPLGDLLANLFGSVNGRINGTAPGHVLALHARVAVAGVIIGLAVLGLLRRRRAGIDDRVLLALLCMPVFAFGLQSYGGEIALRIYLFMLPAASVLGACLPFPRRLFARPDWRVLTAMAGCAVVLPAAFFLARYGNEAYEQIPPGELTAANWVYAHDAHGVRLLWLSTDPATDNTPEMPWSYEDLAKVDYVPVLAPTNPVQVQSLVADLRSNGPGSYLISAQTQVAANQETASYATDWGSRFDAEMAAAPGVRVAFSDSSAVIYTLRWPPGAHQKPLAAGAPATPAHNIGWAWLGLDLLWLLLAMLTVREFTRVWRPRARTIRLLTWCSLPLLALFAEVVVLRFVVMS